MDGTARYSIEREGNQALIEWSVSIPELPFVIPRRGSAVLEKRRLWGWLGSLKWRAVSGYCPKEIQEAALASLVAP